MNPDEALAAGDWLTVLQALSDLQREGAHVDYGWILTNLSPGARVEREEGPRGARFTGWLPARNPGPRRFALDGALELTEGADGAWSWTPPPPNQYDPRGDPPGSWVRFGTATTGTSTTILFRPGQPTTNGTGPGVESW